MAKSGRSRSGLDWPFQDNTRRRLTKLAPPMVKANEIQLRDRRLNGRFFFRVSTAPGGASKVAWRVWSEMGA